MSQAGHLLWRCRRGARELDELLLRYLKRGYPDASAEERSAFERLLELQDPQLQDYFSGLEQPQEAELVRVIHRIVNPDT